MSGFQGSGIDPKDLEITIYPERQGGQHVGVYTGVQITHIPSGLIAICQTERSQHKNKAIALDMIVGGLTSQHFRG